MWRPTQPNIRCLVKYAGPYSIRWLRAPRHRARSVGRGLLHAFLCSLVPGPHAVHVDDVVLKFLDDLSAVRCWFGLAHDCLPGAAISSDIHATFTHVGRHHAHGGGGRARGYETAPWAGGGRRSAGPGVRRGGGGRCARVAGRRGGWIAPPRGARPPYW